jgi:hypothetical protein
MLLSAFPEMMPRSILLTEVMIIADEIDSQLSPAMASYIAEAVSASLPV